MDKLLIVDGHNLLFQMFYGMPHHFYGKNNQPIWATFGFVGALFKIIDIIKPSNVLVVFDGEHGNQRFDLLDEYKSNRFDFSNVKDDENPFIQLEYIYKCLDYLNLKYYETVNNEADDIIAGYVNKYSEKKIVIVSNDTDFCQLVSKNVNILKYKGKNSKLLTEADVFVKFGVHPYQYASFKSLVGDSSDVIKGVKGVGIKTAAKLLLEYDNLFAIIDNINEIKNDKIKNNILEYKERLYLNYKLIHLNYCGDLPYVFEELRYDLPCISTKELLEKIDIM